LWSFYFDRFVNQKKLEAGVDLQSQYKSAQNKPRKTSKRDDKKILKVELENRKKSRSDICDLLEKDYNICISTVTLTRRLTERGFHYRRNTKKFLLTVVMAQKRLKWGKQHRRWKEDDWNKVSVLSPTKDILRTLPSFASLVFELKKI
jgi:transposase